MGFGGRAITLLTLCLGLASFPIQMLSWPHDQACNLSWLHLGCQCPRNNLDDDDADADDDDDNDDDDDDDGDDDDGDFNCYWYF